MAHFARVDKNNIVRAVHVVDNENILNENGIEEEDFGIAYLNKIHGTGLTWIQTSINDNFRIRFAGVGDTYDKEQDAFIPPKPYPSWGLNEDTYQWEAPVSYPDDGGNYSWNEDTQTWAKFPKP